MGQGRGVADTYLTCPDCGGSGEAECGTREAPCENDPCRGHCDEPCNTCTGEGRIPWSPGYRRIAVPTIEPF